MELIRGFEEPVDNADLLIGKALAYAGYSYQLLSETFCEVYFDAGPRMTPEQGMEIAIARFDEALQLVGSATSGEGRSIRNMALVGRARANLHLGNGAQVVADASQVDHDFERLIDRSGINAFRYNQVFHRSNEDDAYSVSNLQSTYREVEIDGYWTLTVDGVPDPRVRSTGPTLGSNLHTPLYQQQKYLSRASPIPFSTWKEAQLMIAEVEGGPDGGRHHQHAPGLSRAAALREHRSSRDPGTGARRAPPANSGCRGSATGTCSGWTSRSPPV